MWEENLGNQSVLDSRKGDHIFIIQVETFERNNKGESSPWDICLPDFEGSSSSVEISDLAPSLLFKEGGSHVLPPPHQMLWL